MAEMTTRAAAAATARRDTGIRRSPGRDQPRLQDRQGRQALRLCRARRRRRPEGPRRLRQGQGQGGPRGHPQGHRAGQAPHDPRAAARRPDPAPRHGRPPRRRPVVMRRPPPGTGIIAGGPMRAVFEMLGVQDVVSKSLGSQNPYNMIRATIDGLTKEQSPRVGGAASRQEGRRHPAQARSRRSRRGHNATEPKLPPTHKET